MHDCISGREASPNLELGPWKWSTNRSELVVARQPTPPNQKFDSSIIIESAVTDKREPIFHRDESKNCFLKCFRCVERGRMRNFSFGTIRALTTVTWQGLYLKNKQPTYLLGYKFTLETLSTPAYVNARHSIIYFSWNVTVYLHIWNLNSLLLLYFFIVTDIESWICVEIQHSNSLFQYRYLFVYKSNVFQILPR